MSPRGRAILAALAIPCLSACQTRVVTSDGRPMPPEPRPASAAPAGAAARFMILLSSPPEDANGNGYPDVIPVVAALMTDPRYRTLEAEGAFVFALFRRGDATRPDAAPLFEWRFEGDVVRHARTTAPYGPCYQFRLSLLEGTGDDRRPATQADLRGRFEPAAGGQVVHTSDEVRAVQIGRGGVATRRPSGDGPGDGARPDL